MSRPVLSVDTGTSVREATTVLTEHGFAAVPVVDDIGHVVGIFSESDALRADIRDRDVPVTSAMATPVEVVAPTTDVGVIAERMLARRLRCVPVVEEGLLVGVVSRRDLLHMLVRDDDVIKAKLRHLLDDYAGSRRHWTVKVVDGDVTVSGDFADDAERTIVAALARTVAGVYRVDLMTTTPVSIGWDD
jgi:CBS domain-containing protein